MNLIPPEALRFADLIFHVLAHVRGAAGEQAALYDPDHTRFAEQILGSPSRRAFGEDLAALDQLFEQDKPALLQAQLLAWTFRSLPKAKAAARKSLHDLDPAEVDDPHALTIAQQAGDAGELLWCAALLEQTAFEQLPPRTLEGLLEALEPLLPIAPALADLDLGLVPSLGARGRVRGREIWIGTRSLEQAIWQAAHEATVSEVDDESRAIALLRERVRGTIHEPAHARWLAGLRL